MSLLKKSVATAEAGKARKREPKASARAAKMTQSRSGKAA